MKKSLIVKTAFIAAMIAVVVLSSDIISADPSGKAITFSKDVAPIFQQRCEECHRAGGVAPMPLTTFEETRPWARAIREKVVSRQMPPFHATGAVGRYANDPRLTDSEIATIRDWVDGGAKPGDSRQLPTRREWKVDWSLGQPDLIVSHPRPFSLARNEKDLYVFFVFDHVFSEDTWINSIQVRPGVAKVVHHANVHLVPPAFKAPPEGYIAGDFDPSARGTIMISGWVPGTNTVRLSEGTAVRIPRGMRLGIQIHYAPTDKSFDDQTQVGVYFANGVVNKNLRLLFGDRKDLVIQPGQVTEFVARNTFQTDAVIKFFHVHMHLRGKSYVMKLRYPDGREETAIEVQNYDFNWQRTYILNEPMRVPKGTAVEFIGGYDNSARNKFNPDPAQVVRWGEFTRDEMMQGRIFYEAADENLNLKVIKGRAVSSGEAARGQ
ncbi:MAG: cytochrome c [Acidobacteriota bacterium]